MKIKLTIVRSNMRKRVLLAIMKTFIFLFCTTVFSFNVENMFSQEKIKIDHDQLVTVGQVFKIIQNQTDYDFIYPKRLFKDKPKIQLKRGEVLITELLKKSLLNNEVDFELSEGNIVIIKSSTTFKKVKTKKDQGVELSGSVVDVSGVPLPGANIIEKGTNNGTQSDFDGNFSLTVTDTNAVLVVSYLGYLTKEVTLNEETTLTIVLQEDSAKLDEVIVVGYGTKKKSDVTGAIASVGLKDFEAQPVTQVTDAIQGRTSGVQVNSFSGAPGSEAKIRVRGVNSITGSSEPLVVIDGIIGGRLSALNPNDIKSIEILKDASATALYGSRGSNGVVLVTTNSGKSQDGMEVSINSFITSSVLPKKIGLLDGASFAETVNAQDAAGGSSPRFSDGDITALRASGGTDWQDEIYRTGITQNYQVGVSGRSNKVGYYASANWTDQEGIVLNSDLTRAVFRTNLNFDASEKVKVRLNFSHSREDALNSNLETSTSNQITPDVLIFRAPTAGALTFDPTSPTRDVNGIPITLSTFGTIGESPLATALGRNDRYKRNTTSLNSTVSWKITDDLIYTFTGGLRNIVTNNQFFLAGFGSSAGVPSASQSLTDFNLWQHTHVLEFSKEIKKHKFSIKGIFEEQSIKESGFQAIGSGLLTESVTVNNLGLANAQSINSNLLEESIISYVGRVEYGFIDKYLLTGTLRVDGSSKFPSANRYGVFPSVALGWKISEEDFLKESETINNLKLRASYGQIGNQAIQPFASLATFRTGANFNAVIDNSTISVGVAPGVAANPDLKWETTAQLNIGIDAGLFNNRVRTSIDWYKKNTTDLLLQTSTPTFTGLSSVLRNTGEIENRGIEFNVDAVIIDKGDFTWNTAFNFAKNEIEVLDIGDEDALFSENVYAGASSIPSRVEVGGTIGNFYGYIYDGVWKSSEASQAATFGSSPGDARYRDLNNDGVIGSDDISIIGNGNPDFVWGLNNTFSYKGLQLNVFLQGMSGFDVFNVAKASTLVESGDFRTPTNAEILNRWTPNNEDTDVPGFTSTGVNFVESSRFIEKGSFMRLKNIRLAYDLPESILKSTFFKNVKVYVSGQNVFTITDYSGYDPEVSGTANSNLDNSIDTGGYPNPRSYTFGVNLTF